ncbi:hypothetical protein CI109_101694 [Kwoniella shandongensis]|uniref:Uncharacterized protein n=1 Tax=Kwoniella shandongensis TaxID=1734106 RepID=A0A5M6CBB7_9TREE|nr:uncharacterized protein CI109_001182 [Kwoniella shandongensis]KAA5530379.1 hypothetical protein CI109_001182 [Kwoniella shandongensis]
MPAAKVEKEAWGDNHTDALIRGMIAEILARRPDLYRLPELQGVSDNGGNRINQKIQQILKKMCALYPGTEQMVEEEVQKLKGNKAASGGGTPKKRKIKAKEEDDE